MYSHLLIPLDGSHFAETAIPRALALAEKFGSQITLLQVVVPPQPLAADVGGMGDMLLQLRELATKEAESYLVQKTGELIQQGYSVKWEMMVDTTPAHAILSIAETEGVDTIVMSTHGRSGLGRFVFGSVAEKVIHHTDIPVLLIRAKE